jgi:hypothetical protein
MNYPDMLKPLLKKFLPFAQERMGFSDPPRLFLKSNNKNAQDPLGKTAFYDPNNKAITVFVTNRHPKDIMRSVSHELVHHTQNCRGDFDKVGTMGDGYAQNDEHLREMEREAYEVGNLCFRDWEDSIKNTIYFEHLQKGDNKMSTKDWKNKEIRSLLSEAWGFKMDLSKLNEGGDHPYNRDDDEESLEEGDAAGNYDGDKDLAADLAVDDSDTIEEGEEEEDLEEASNPRDVNKDRQRPGRNPADRVHESDKGADELKEALVKILRKHL